MMLLQRCLCRQRLYTAILHCYLAVKFMIDKTSRTMPRLPDTNASSPFRRQRSRWLQPTRLRTLSMALAMDMASSPIDQHEPKWFRVQVFLSISNCSKANQEANNYIVFVLCQEHERANPHVDKVEASNGEVGQEHDKVSVVEVPHAVVNPWTMLMRRRKSLLG